MSTYLERYLNGEYEPVWAELTALGGQIRQEPFYTDALAVAEETMRRVKQNIGTLKSRLYEIGYKFLHDDPDWGKDYFNEVDYLAIIKRLEAADLTLPLSLKVFYQSIGMVNFMGAHPKLSEYVGFGSDEFESSEVYSDPIVIEPPYYENLEEYDYYYEDKEDDKTDSIKNQEYPMLCRIEIAPDEVHKANYSGGTPYWIEIGAPAMDRPLQGDRNYGTFVEYLRKCFQWGGFPGLADSKNPPTEELAFLTKDLLPI